jgi:hypothetical protein
MTSVFFLGGNPCTRTFHPQIHNWLSIICGAHMDEEKSSSCIIFLFSCSSLAAFCRSRARACSSGFSSLPSQLQCRGIVDALPEAWYVFELTYSMLQIECMILFYFILQIFYLFGRSYWSKFVVAFVSRSYRALRR